MFTLFTFIIILIPCVFTLVIAQAVINLMTRKLTKRKLNQVQQVKIFFALVIIYLLIGMYFTYDYLLFPQNYDPQYLKRLESAPVWKDMLIILIWPFGMVQAPYLHYLDPILRMLMK